VSKTFAVVQHSNVLGQAMTCFTVYYDREQLVVVEIMTRDGSMKKINHGRTTREEQDLRKTIEKSVETGCKHDKNVHQAEQKRKAW
jgi:hypothetical protein